ncbi:N-acetyltransferase [Mycolicibacterium novocastrense]|uniref:N-acetyltransferase domain-containing protein n=1 Tax=Mycolicibacterium novocastrense TaxID=59813 RepID=A0ABQ0KLL0_MYCNV|nr:N-acetyltransferase [Mycolicibacterium novocastrense]GAT10197.1 putative uncharacterized protein [Mycolicibacterium novocastrense]
MTFEFVDLRRGTANRYSWVPPFDESQRYDHDRWWDEVRELDDDPWYVQVLDARTEVARIKLGDRIEIDHYAGVPDLGAEGLEIDFFEVATEARGKRVGTLVIEQFARRHPDRRLLAYSERADEFWASLGWSSFMPPDYDPDHEDPSTLFIAPPCWQTGPDYLS